MSHEAAYPNILVNATGNKVLWNGTKVLFSGKLLGGLKFNTGAVAEIASAAGLDVPNGGFGFFCIYSLSALEASPVARVTYQRSSNKLSFSCNVSSTSGQGVSRLDFVNTVNSRRAQLINLVDNAKWTQLNGRVCSSFHNNDSNTSRDEFYNYSNRSGSNGTSSAIQSLGTFDEKLKITMGSGNVIYALGLFNSTIGVNSPSLITELSKNEGRTRRLTNFNGWRYLYLFDSEEGTTVKDYSGNGFDLTLSGFTSTTKGNPSNAWVNAYTLQPK